MSGFSNPLVGGGGALVYPSIHSPNYVPTISGWSIKKDGSAEFQNAIIRGSLTVSTITASRMTIDSFGNMNFFNAFGAVIFRIDAQKDAVFMYADTGSAAQGATIYAWASTIGTDPINGTSYSAGFNNLGAGGTAGLTALLAGASLVLSKVSGAFAPPLIQLQDATNSSSLIATTSGMRVVAPASGSNALDFRRTGDLGPRVLVSDAGVVTLGSGSVSQDTTALYRAAAGELGMAPILFDNGGTGEDWQSMNARGYQNGWTDNGTGDPGAYRRSAGLANMVQLSGELKGGTLTDNTVLINLPTGFHPVNNQICYILVPGTGAAANMRLSIGTNGNVTCFGISGLAAGPRIALDNIAYRVD